MSLKLAADEILKIADMIDKDAAEVTTFVCDKCNHTATLETINAKRVEAAKKASIETVAEITVNDSVQCPACEGSMTYKETEASAPYYYEEKKAEEAEEDEKEKEDKEKKAQDYDAIK
jgi:uncharacterized Zn finger protein (UPF0148 family)